MLPEDEDSLVKYWVQVINEYVGSSAMPIAHGHGPARDKIAYRWINWSNFGPMLYVLKRQTRKIFDFWFWFHK
jgi:hypothetical protein